MTRSTVILLMMGVALLVTACGGGDSEEPTATSVGSVVATATPFATLPTTTILDGSGGVSGETTPAPDVTYTVVAGDSLSLIADQNGTTVEAIQALNGLTDVNIFVDQELLIPGEDGGTATPQPTTAPSGNTQTYTVQSGDSGFGISLEFEITLEQLAAANGMSVDQLDELFVGQELLIPTP